MGTSSFGKSYANLAILTPSAILATNSEKIPGSISLKVVPVEPKCLSFAVAINHVWVPSLGPIVPAIDTPSHLSSLPNNIGTLDREAALE